MKRPSHSLNCVTGDSCDDIYIHVPIVLYNRHVHSFFTGSKTDTLLKNKFILISDMFDLSIKESLNNKFKTLHMYFLFNNSFVSENE